MSNSIPVAADDDEDRDGLDLEYTFTPTLPVAPRYVAPAARPVTLVGADALVALRAVAVAADNFEAYCDLGVLGPVGRSLRDAVRAWRASGKVEP